MCQYIGHRPGVNMFTQLSHDPIPNTLSRAWGHSEVSAANGPSLITPSVAQTSKM